MDDLIKKLKTLFKEGDISVRFIFINVAVFLVSFLINTLFLNGKGYQLQDYFGAVSSYENLLQQPWGVFTFSFFHGNLLHLFFNMLMLYFVGQLFLRYFRKEDFLIFYFFGAFFGALFFMAFSQLLGYGNVLVGASAAIYSVFFALVAYIPKTRVQFAIFNFTLSLDYFAYCLLAFDFIMILADQNAGGHLSHLGGAAFGFLYMKQFEKGKDFLGNFFRNLVSSERKKDQNPSKKPPRDDYAFNSQKVDNQKAVDKILDKISRSGYESLSKEEKDFLFKSGKK